MNYINCKQQYCKQRPAFAFYSKELCFNLVTQYFLCVGYAPLVSLYMINEISSLQIN